MKDICISKKLNLLEPDEGTIVNYKEIETKSIDKLKEFLENGDPKYNSVSIQILSAVNKLRSTMKSQMTMRASIFKSIAENKKEYKQYIKVSFPNMLNRK